LVIDLLGPSLEDMFDTCGRRFSVKTTAMLAKQMVKKKKNTDYFSIHCCIYQISLVNKSSNYS
jgi:hypothetical protein